MGRSRRVDYEGAWHHVYNRGIAKRAMFETTTDVQAFLDLVGEEVARGRIEVHAYSVLTTHFHLQVRSLLGQLSRTVQWFTNQYVRGFNRSHRRDGTLLRGRFKSKLIEDPVYWETVVRYIDLNPVGSICDLPSGYPHCSAAAYRYGDGPEWLTRDLVAGVACEGRWDGGPIEDYDSFAMNTPIDVVRQIVKGHLRHGRRGQSAGPGPMRYDDLVRGASGRQHAWMGFKARLADGTAPGSLVLAHTTLRAILDRCRARVPWARATTRTLPGSLWQVMEVGVLRDLTGLTLAEVSELTGASIPVVHRREERHRVLLERDARYRNLVLRIARRAVDQDFRRPRHVILPAARTT